MFVGISRAFVSLYWVSKFMEAGSRFEGSAVQRTAEVCHTGDTSMMFSQFGIVLVDSPQSKIAAAVC